MKATLLRLALVAILLAALPAAALTRYVDVNSTNATPPYTNWSTVANVIQDAVDSAVAGDTVLVTNGVYDTGGRAVYGLMTNRVAVDKPLTLLSVNGPEFTAIHGYQLPVTTNGDGAIRCVYLTSGAVLSGFTLTKGATRGPNGNSKLEHNGGGIFGGGAYPGPIVTNCLIVSNAAFFWGGGAISATLLSCEVRENSAVDGGGVYASGQAIRTPSLFLLLYSGPKS